MQGRFLANLVDLVCGVLVLVRRHHIEPEQPSPHPAG